MSRDPSSESQTSDSNDESDWVPVNRRQNGENGANPVEFRLRRESGTTESSSLRRAGLFHPHSFASSYLAAVPHSQGDIRASTMRLSGVTQQQHVTFAPNAPTHTTNDTQQLPTHYMRDPSRIHPGESYNDGSAPSGLSILLAQRRNPNFQSNERANLTSESDDASSLDPSEVLERRGRRRLVTSESEPLLGTTGSLPSYSFPRSDPSIHSSHTQSRSPSSTQSIRKRIKYAAQEHLSASNLKDVLKTAALSLPAVLLGMLLNILDGVSYGMIAFPSTGIFSTLGGMGVSMFFVTTVAAQLVYTLGGSGFAGANGSMMIEVVPFFHIIATSIADQIGEDKPEAVLATTLVAFSLSSILTGITFLLLGKFKLGSLIGFFPRHILVGCIGGVGAFLIETGLAVCLRISDDEFHYDLPTLKRFFASGEAIALWMPALALAILLRVITSRFHHQLIFPLYFIAIPVLFYVVVLSARIELTSLRTAGWLFDMGDTADDKWYEFYMHYNFKLVEVGPLLNTIPTQLALLFFNILHPPLNVPALAVSINEDVDTNKELVAHGYSNLLGGALGSVPNYLVYVNTVLFYRVGGGTRIAGFLLAVATFVLLIIGTAPISFLPVLMVGALIFVLGIDLIKEALWDTRHRVNRTEYLTIFSIMVVMTVWDFVIGVLFGIVVSCFFFVVQNSQRESIRVIHTGETATSTVRRPAAHRAYLREVAKQTVILRLQGFLFFGTITRVEETIRAIIDNPSWNSNPVRFLIVDLTSIGGVDMSSAEAFVRIQRLLSAKTSTLVLCGFSANSPIGIAFESVELFNEPNVELFSTYNDALEWTENAYLRVWFSLQKTETQTQTVALPGRQTLDISFNQSMAASPRRSHLKEVGARTIAEDPTASILPRDTSEPLSTLIKVFAPFAADSIDTLRGLASYFKRVTYGEGKVIFRQGDPSDGVYLIESGILRALYNFGDHSPKVEESMVPGTLAGELSALSGLPRNATVVVDKPCTLWMLSTDTLRELERTEPALASSFTHLIIKSAKVDHDTLLTALAARQ